MKAREFIPASKPRNFVAKNQKTAGAGAHKDKKRADKQGDVKHKKQTVPMEGFTKADADRNKAKYQKSGRVGQGLDWKNYGDDYKTLVNDIVDKFDNITRLIQYSEAPEPTKYKILERFFKKYGYPFELFNDVITGIEKRAAGETNRYGRVGLDGIDEGWREKLAAAGLAATIGLGAVSGANARVLPGADPSVNRFTGEPVAAQQVKSNDEKKVSGERKFDFSTEYLKKIVDGKHPRPMISVDDAKQELERRGER